MANFKAWQSLSEKQERYLLRQVGLPDEGRADGPRGPAVDAALGRFHGLPLAGVETFEDICHVVGRIELYKFNKKRLPGAKINSACAHPEENFSRQNSQRV